jgi:hypothetical protein
MRTQGTTTRIEDEAAERLDRMIGDMLVAAIVLLGLALCWHAAF